MEKGNYKIKCTFSYSIEAFSLLILDLFREQLNLPVFLSVTDFVFSLSQLCLCNYDLSSLWEHFLLVLCFILQLPWSRRRSLGMWTLITNWLGLLIIVCLNLFSYGFYSCRLCMFTIPFATSSFAWWKFISYSYAAILFFVDAQFLSWIVAWYKHLQYTSET